MPAFDIDLRDALPHGVLVGVRLPREGQDVPDDVLERLHPEERDLASTLRGYRRIDFVGGRLAARAALEHFDRNPRPLLQDDRGAPVYGRGLAVSISHKRDLAVALAARAEHGAIGIDLEDLGPQRTGIADRVLTDAELDAVQQLPAERHWTSILVRFVIKEAIYKALAPTLRRYIGFEEAQVTPDVDGTAVVSLTLKEGEPNPKVEARYHWIDGRVLATVRARF